MLEENHRYEVPSGQHFELLFRWGETWLNVIVYPVKYIGTSIHFLVELTKNLNIIIRKNEFGEWEELKEGVTELARHLGKAIQENSWLYR